ncbi:MAG: hypothetical protein ACRDVF_18380 [Microbacterium sp.]|uniref:hypothetical protein n=1 Tax=Microbacterium sp. TaxID=51671 RepID=UPI003D701305
MVEISRKTNEALPGQAPLIALIGLGVAVQFGLWEWPDGELLAMERQWTSA